MANALSRKAYVFVKKFLAAKLVFQTHAGGDDNATPLHDAVASGCAEVIRALVLKGADKSALDSNGKTPAEMALAGSKVLEVLDQTSSLLSESEQLEQSMTAPQTKVQNYVVATADPGLIKQLDRLKVSGENLVEIS